MNEARRSVTGSPNAVRRTVPMWGREILLAASFYGLYTLGRDLQGSATVSYAHALTNASRIIGLERRLGLFREGALQRALLGHRWVIEAANFFYGSLHMIATIAVLVYLFRHHRHAYQRVRNALAVTTGLALIGFVAFPTLPPRLLPARYGFVDTLSKYGTLWSFDSGAISKLSNQYAAMPSLHFAWALWCSISLITVLRHRCARVAVFIYPLLTLAAIIVTANHFILDAAFGAGILGTGLAVAARPLRSNEASPRAKPLPESA